MTTSSQRPSKLGVPAIGADLAEADRCEQAPARLVVDEDPGDELPEARCLGGLDEAQHRGATGTTAARIPRDVDGELGDTGIGVAWPVRRRGREPDDLIRVIRDDDDRVAAVEPLADLGEGPRPRLERRNPIRDALVVDPGDGSRVVRLGLTACQLGPQIGHRVVSTWRSSGPIRSGMWRKANVFAVIAAS